MARRVVQQPDGDFAIWSTIVDNWVMVDATPNQIVREYMRQAREEARERANRALENATKSDPLLGRWEDYEARRIEIHGKGRKK